MPYFKDLSNKVHFLDSAADAGKYLPAGSIQITDAQAAAILNPTLTLAQSQAAQIAVLAAAYGAAIQQPVNFATAGAVVKTYQADPGSVSNLQNTLLGLQKAALTPTGFYWVAADNTQVPFTYADLQGLAAAMLSQGWSAFQHLQTQKAVVLAATTVAAVQAAVW